MSPSFKPEGYPSASPYLIVENPRRSIDFIVQVFEGKELRAFSDAEGRIRHAEVRIDDSVVMMGGAMAGWPSFESHIHLYVEDVDATFAAALSAGAKEVQKPVQKDDEDKRGGIQDPSGTTWWISTRQQVPSKR